MNITEVLRLAGQIAGIGGISLIVFLVLFREIIRKTIFPNLTKHQGYKLLTLIVILIALITLAGIVVWAIDRHSVSSGATIEKLDKIDREQQVIHVQVNKDIAIPLKQLQEEIEKLSLAQGDAGKLLKLYTLLSAKNLDLQKRIATAKVDRLSLAKETQRLFNDSGRVEPYSDQGTKIESEIHVIQQNDRELETLLDRLSERSSQLQEDLAALKSVAGNTLKQADR